MSPGGGLAHASKSLLITEALVLTLAVFFVLFALAVVWAALWYSMRQEKQVRTDREGEGYEGHDGEDDGDFVLRPGEQEEHEDTLEPGTERFRKA